jgi:hypothetical protein
MVDVQETPGLSRVAAQAFGKDNLAESTQSALNHIFYAQRSIGNCKGSIRAFGTASGHYQRCESAL